MLNSNRNGSSRLRRPFLLGGIVALTLCLGWASPAEAQRMRRTDETLTKSAPQIREAVSGILESARQGIVRIVVDNETAALGTVVRDDGIVLTKASELGENFVVELYDGRQVEGRLLGVAQEHDLAAIKLDVGRIPSLNVDAEAVETSFAGGWVLSPEPEDGAVLGNLSVTGLRRIPSSGGLLGVGLGRTQAGIPVFRVDPGGAADRAGLKAGDVITHIDGQLVGTMRDFVRGLRNAPPESSFRLTISRDGEAKNVPMVLRNGGMGVTLVTEAEGVLIASVTLGSGAEAAGVQVGDILLEINDRPVRDGPAVIQAVSRYRPGDQVSLLLLRQGQEQELEATIGYRSGRSERGDLQNRLGTSLSNRAVDFPAVLQHDSVLNAHEMGGPLLDLHGNVLGLNIARAGRTETYALPAQVIQGILPELLSGKLPAATAPVEPDQEALPETGLQEE